MNMYRFRNGFEEGEANIYAIAFQCCLHYNVEVFLHGTWTPANKVTDVAKLIPQQNAKPTYQYSHNSSYPLYISDEIVAILSPSELALSIAANPKGKHEIQWFEQVVPHNWFSDEKIYSEVLQLLKEDCPGFVEDATANAIQPNYWIPNKISWKWMPDGSINKTSELCALKKFTPSHNGVRALKSTNMKIAKHFSSQIKIQTDLTSIQGALCYHGSMRRNFDKIKNSIPDVIKDELREHGTCRIPYIGTLTLRGTRLCFSASRHLKDILKGKQVSQKRLDMGRAFGGEANPDQSIQLWHHKVSAQSSKGSALSKRRIFVNKLTNHKNSFRNIAVANVLFQAFCDALIFRLKQGVPVTLYSIGTFRPANGRVHFRKSSKFNISIEK